MCLPGIISCEKKQDEVMPQGILEDSAYKVRLFFHSDSGFIRYNIRNDYNKHYATHFDTTFYCNGGWEELFFVTAFSWPMNAGLVVNDSVIDNCSNVHSYGMTYKFE